MWLEHWRGEGRGRGGGGPEPLFADWKVHLPCGSAHSDPAGLGWSRDSASPASSSAAEAAGPQAALGVARTRREQREPGLGG